MKKLILAILVLISLNSFGQCIDISDSVTNNTATLITATTARINGNGDNGDVSGNTIKLRYVRVGQVDTVTSTTLWPTVVRNLTGLQSGTQYVYYYSMDCGDGDVRQLGRYYFTTLSSNVVYATERSTVFPYIKSDTGWVVPRQDTALFRQPSTTGGNIVFNPTDSVFYGYNKARWVPLMNSTAGISNKVDSVTVDSDTLFYWVNGTAYGEILPAAINVSDSAWSLTGNAGTTAGTNFIGTTDAQGLMFKVNSTKAGYIDIATASTSFGEGSLFNNGLMGSNNTAFGFQSLYNNVSSAQNTALGSQALLNTTGENNTGFGHAVLASNTTGINNIGFGKEAGYYNTTQSSRLYINSLNRTNILGDTTKSIIYGAQDATAANQRLYLNSQLFNPYIAAQSNGADSMVVVLPSTGKFGYRAIPTSGSPSLTSTYIGYGDGSNLLTGTSGFTYDVAATTGSGLSLASSAITSGALATFTNTGTAAASNTKKVLSIVSSGANGTASQTVTGQTISVTNTGTTNTNVGLNVTASGGTTNTAILATGRVGINTTPTNAVFEVSGTAYISGAVTTATLTPFGGIGGGVNNAYDIGSTAIAFRSGYFQRALSKQGADVASTAGAMTLGTDGTSFEITGTNSITLLSNVGWANGNEVTLMFTGAATLVNGTATSGTNIQMLLAGGVDFIASANDVITLILSEIGGTQVWREKSRSVN